MTLDKVSFQRRVTAPPPPVAQPVARTAPVFGVRSVAPTRKSYFAAKAHGLTVRMAALKGGPVLFDRAGRPVGTFRPHPLAAPPPAASGPRSHPTGALATDTFGLDGVSVLALVCKRVPKSPDPDPAFTW
jgi:hypothetical protein